MKSVLAFGRLFISNEYRGMNIDSLNHLLLQRFALFAVKLYLSVSFKELS